MYYIINELGYQGELFDDYDRFVSRFSYDRHRVLKTERIGKQYQWITMYNILARISDYYPMKNQFLMEEEIVTYQGPWEPYVKEFDPTLNVYNLLCDDAPYFSQINEHIRESVQEKDTIPFLAMYGSRRLIIRSELELWLQNHPHEKEALKNGTYRKTAQEA